VQEQLRLIHQLDSDWNVDIMSSKVGLNKSYDPIVLPFRDRTWIREQLGDVDEFLRLNHTFLAALAALEPDQELLSNCFGELSALTTKLGGQDLDQALQKLANDSVYGLDQI
jgi:hypothetical protein